MYITGYSGCMGLRQLKLGSLTSIQVNEPLYNINIWGCGRLPVLGGGCMQIRAVSHRQVLYVPLCNNRCIHAHKYHIPASVILVPLSSI